MAMSTRAPVGLGLPWAGAAAAAALVLTALGVLIPWAPFALLGAVALLLVAAFRPKAFALLVISVIIMTTLIQNAAGPVGSYADEVMVAVAAVAFPARRLVTEGRVVWLPGGGWFAGYVAAGLISAGLADVPAGTAVPAAFIAVKGVVLAFALAQLRWTREDLETLVRLGIVASVLMMVTAAINLAIPTAWAHLTTGRPPITSVGAIPAINGLFQHPAAFSRFCGVLAIGGLLYGVVVRRSVANTLLVILTAGLGFLTLQVKSIIGVLATLAVVGVRFLRWSGAVALLCLGPLVALLVVPPLMQLVGTDLALYVAQDSARSMLTEGGVTVAAQYFPLGAGFGQYGSATAADQYSPLYFALGFDDRFGLGPGPDSGQFLNDNQWPAIVGEAGWFGAAFFTIGLACMLVCLLRRTSADEDVLVRWLRITGVGWMILLVVESVASPVFVSPPSFPFVFGAAAIAASFRQPARTTPSGTDDVATETVPR